MWDWRKLEGLSGARLPVPLHRRPACVSPVCYRRCAGSLLWLVVLAAEYMWLDTDRFWQPQRERENIEGLESEWKKRSETDTRGDGSRCQVNIWGEKGTEMRQENDKGNGGKSEQAITFGWETKWGCDRQEPYNNWFETNRRACTVCTGLAKKDIGACWHRSVNTCVITCLQIIALFAGLLSSDSSTLSPHSSALLGQYWSKS